MKGSITVTRQRLANRSAKVAIPDHFRNWFKQATGKYLPTKSRSQVQSMVTSKKESLPCTYPSQWGTTSQATNHSLWIMLLTNFSFIQMLNSQAGEQELSFHWTLALLIKITTHWEQALSICLGYFMIQVHHLTITSYPKPNSWRKFLNPFLSFQLKSCLRYSDPLFRPVTQIKVRESSMERIRYGYPAKFLKIWTKLKDPIGLSHLTHKGWSSTGTPHKAKDPVS